MSPMKPSASDRLSAKDHRHIQGDSADTDKRNAPHFESLRVPDLMSVPLFTAWLRKPFRRKATHS
jgi:hypothetical protein